MRARASAVAGRIVQLGETLSIHQRVGVCFAS